MRRLRVSVSFLWDWDKDCLLMKKIIIYLSWFFWKFHIQIRTRQRQDWVKSKQMRRDEVISKFLIFYETETWHAPKLFMRPRQDRESWYRRIDWNSPPSLSTHIYVVYISGHTCGVYVQACVWYICRDMFVVYLSRHVFGTYVWCVCSDKFVYVQI